LQLVKIGIGANKTLARALFLISSQVNSETIYIILEKDNALAIVDPIAGKLLKTVAIGQRPRGIVLSKNQQQICFIVSLV
jgi:hypothetical protein